MQKVIKGSMPEFFPKVERAGSGLKSKKEADASELLSSSSASSSGASAKSEKPAAPKFTDALRDARVERAEKRETARLQKNEDKTQYNQKDKVTNGSQPQGDSKLADKVARRDLDGNKKDLKTKAVKGDEFVMPGMLPSKFTTPKRGLDTALATNEMIPGVAGEDAMMQQEAVNEFIEQMQEQFGISAEQILAAFSQMTPQVLAAPVSESTQAFVNELPLNADQKPKAAALYSLMLEQTGDQVFSEQMAGNADTAVGTQVIGKKEYNQQVLDKSLQELNQQFFRNGKVETQKDQNGKLPVSGMTAASGTVALGSAQAANSSASASTVANTMGSISSSGNSSGNLSPASKKSIDASPASVAAFMSGMTSAIASEAKSSSSPDAGSDWSQQSQQQQPQVNAAEVASKFSAQGEFMAAGAFTPEIAHAKTSALGAEGKETKALKGDDLLSALNSSLSQGLTSTKLAEGGAAATMLPGAVQPTQEQQDANIQNLIKQAQIIIKDGGGEMKLEMSPEGMGQVNLKVAVENGQVNIQMITDNKEAKKMLEEGLSDLKASLAAHKLQVDTLKVDLSDGISKQMQEQLHDHKQNQAREFAQNFLGNMRDERQGFRQGFFDNSGHRAYKNQNEREGGVPQAPVGSVAGSQKKQTDRRLDMVA